jgi:hypothetical protein
MNTVLSNSTLFQSPKLFPTLIHMEQCSIPFFTFPSLAPFDHPVDILTQ